MSERRLYAAAPGLCDAVTGTNLHPMPNRALSRSLLSLLILWQLLASVLAHPLPIAPAQAPADPVIEAVATSEMAMDDCPHAAHHDHADMLTAAQQPESQATHDQTTHTDHQSDAPSAQHSGHSCQTACKCPCAGTPALGFSLPDFSAALPGSTCSVVDTSVLTAPPLANLLRPPIA